jgi:formylmethanofuran dehydrogenase subunit E
MDAGIIELKKRKDEICAELKSIDANDRARRHELLDEYGEIDTRMMIEKTKVGEWECDSCGKWGRLVMLKLGDRCYEVCKKCYGAESDGESNSLS